MNNKQAKNADLREYGMYGLSLLQFMSLLAVLGIALAVLLH